MSDGGGDGRGRGRGRWVGDGEAGTIADAPAMAVGAAWVVRSCCVANPSSRPLVPSRGAGAGAGAGAG